MPNAHITSADLHDLRPIINHAGMSGAILQRGTLTDGRRVVVKQSHAKRDLFQQLLGHELSLEYLLWRDGVFERLPAGVDVAVIGGWVDDNGTSTVVMEDLEDEILGWEHRFTFEEAQLLLRRLDELHSADIRPSCPPTQLDNVICTFAPARIRQSAPGTRLLKEVGRGWHAFARFSSPHLRSAVQELVDRPGRLVQALNACPSTFCHGDVAAVNMAWRGDHLVLMDWGQAFIGPPALDIARFLPSGLRDSGLDRDWFIKEYAKISGSRFDEHAMHLSILATLVWFGWRKALDATEHADPQRRVAESEGIEWWCQRASETTGYL